MISPRLSRSPAALLLVFSFQHLYASPPASGQDVSRDRTPQAGARRSAVVSGRQLAPTPARVSAAATPPLARDFDLPLPLFSSGSAWNQDASGAAALPSSDRQILVTYRVLRGNSTSLVPPGPAPTTWPFIDVTLDEFSVPIFRAGAGQQSITVCDYDGVLWFPGPKWPSDQEGGPISTPATAGQVRPAGPLGTDSDGHLVIYDEATSTEFDFWQATTLRDGPCRSRGGGLTGSTILEAGAADHFDVRESGVNDEGVSSARAHGTPLLAGVILPEDVESGAIRHALGFGVPGPRNTSADPQEPIAADIFYPASTTETDFYNTDPDALAAGQRIRLRQSLVDEEGEVIDEGGLAPITRMFLTTVREYGAYLVDNTGGFTFSAEDIHTADLDLDDGQVNGLIGEPSGTPLPGGMTKWQAVISKLNDELELIPFAFGPWEDSQDPATAIITTANWEVIEPATPGGGEPASCTADDQTLCLNRGRFRVEVGWRDFQGGAGVGQVVPAGSDDSGLFWFFGADNWEMLVKVLDGCAVNRHFWVFAAATTNVEYTLTVTDTQSGQRRTYRNSLGVSSPATTDASAFATCP